MSVCLISICQRTYRQTTPSYYHIRWASLSVESGYVSRGGLTIFWVWYRTRTDWGISATGPQPVPLTCYGLTRPYKNKKPDCLGRVSHLSSIILKSTKNMSMTDHGGATASPINRIHMYAHSFHSF